MKINTLIIAAVVSVSHWGFSQGFVNLNFEHGITSSNTIPGWTAFLNGSPMAVLSNNVSISGGSISIMATNSSSVSPIQGKYFVFLASANLQGFGVPISLGQNAQISPLAQTITFWGDIGGMQISFAGHLLNFASTGSTANYTAYSADISPYAGQTGQLLFTLPPYVASAALDNIQFSTTPVPEPATLSLLSLAGFGFWFGQNRWRSGRGSRSRR